MNIIMLDSAQLIGDADFPEVNAKKFGWTQLPALVGDEMSERCWRVDVIISTNTPITAQVISESYKLQLIIAAGDNTDHIDKDAAKARGIMVCNVPGLTGDQPQHTQQICTQVIDIINAWIIQEPINVVE